MQSSLIGKIEKAGRYAREADRVTFSHFEVRFRGEHNSYTVGYKEGEWRCTCSYFATWGLCSHTMALEKMLADKLPKEALHGRMVMST